MSAYMQFDTIHFLNAALLIATLTEMGYKVEMGESLALYGYRGDIRQERAQIVVRRDQIGASSNDLGFTWNGKAFVPIISKFDARHTLTKEWRDNLQATYSKIAVLKFLELKRANISQINTGKLGLHLRATVEV